MLLKASVLASTPATTTATAAVGHGHRNGSGSIADEGYSGYAFPRIGTGAFGAIRRQPGFGKCSFLQKRRPTVLALILIHWHSHMTSKDSSTYQCSKYRILTQNVSKPVDEMVEFAIRRARRYYLFQSVAQEVCG